MVGPHTICPLIDAEMYLYGPCCCCCSVTKRVCLECNLGLFILYCLPVYCCACLPRLLCGIINDDNGVWWCASSSANWYHHDQTFLYIFYPTLCFPCIAASYAASYYCGKKVTPNDSSNSTPGQQQETEKDKLEREFKEKESKLQTEYKGKEDKLREEMRLKEQKFKENETKLQTEYKGNEDKLREENRLLQISRDRLQQEIEDLSYLIRKERNQSGHSDDEFEDFNVKAETSDTLGLSDTLTLKYTAVLNQCEFLRDHPNRLKLDETLKRATENRNVPLIQELIAQKKRFKVPPIDTNFTVEGVPGEVESLLKDMRAWFSNATMRDDCDMKSLGNCAKAIDYIEEVSKKLNDHAALTFVLRKRLAAADVMDDLVFPAGVVRRFWSNIKLPSNAMVGASNTGLIVGQGSFSLVVRAVLETKYGDIEVVVKVLRQQLDNEYRSRCDAALAEAANVAMLASKDIDSRCIPKFYGVVAGPLTTELSSFFKLQDGVNRVGIVFEYQAGGSLHDALYSGTPLSELMKVRILRLVIYALSQLHAVGLVHGDVKPRNILLGSRIVSGDQSISVCISDFGLSAIRETAESAMSGGTTLQHTANYHGTPCYSAPEMFKKAGETTAAKASQKADMYAFSMMMYETFAVVPPFAGVTNVVELVHKVQNGERPNLDALRAQRVSPIIIDIIETCWSSDRSERLTATNVACRLFQYENRLSSAKFDVFFSHRWALKPFLQHVCALLVAKGFRVWYDEDHMGWDLVTSMDQGIKNSKVVIACIDKEYESRENCMHELRGAAKEGKPIVALVLDDISSVLSGNTNAAWRVSKEMDDILKFKTRLFHNMRALSEDQFWAANASKNEDPPLDLMTRLKSSVADLVGLLAKHDCYPSMDISK
jgi:serine/threonine protein kinase